MKRIGVLALQGAFREHIYAIKRTGNFPLEVREVKQLDHVDGLIIPGGESTAISKLMVKYGFINALKNFKKPIFGTCAGAILMAKNVPNFKDVLLNLMDMTVGRNAYGRQIDSFEEDLEIKIKPRVLSAGRHGDSRELHKNPESGFGENFNDFTDKLEHNPVNLLVNNTNEKNFNFHGIFIRAPKITAVGKGVEILSSYKNQPVLVRKGIYLAATFHPELTQDCKVHRLFIEMTEKGAGS